MTRYKSSFLAVLAILFSPIAANADPIVNTGLCDDGVDTCYTGIENLDINGLLYDVDWYSTQTLLSDLLISDPGVATFAGNPGLALAASDAINEAFNDAGNNFSTVDEGTFGNIGLWVVIDFTATTFDFYVPFSTFDIVNGPFVGYSIREEDGPFAIFTQVSVPEPGTLALLGIGLAGMGLARRRKV